MFLYLCLIFLPAAAIATCNREAQDLFFSELDANNDGQIQKSEGDAVYADLNENGDACLTLEEAKARVSSKGLKIKGYEGALYDRFDVDKNNCISRFEATLAFTLSDTNGNNAVSKDEYNRYFGIVCLPENFLCLGRILGGRSLLTVSLG